MRVKIASEGPRKQQRSQKTRDIEVSKSVSLHTALVLSVKQRAGNLELELDGQVVNVALKGAIVVRVADKGERGDAKSESDDGGQLG